MPGAGLFMVARWLASVMGEYLENWCRRQVGRYTRCLSCQQSRCSWWAGEETCLLCFAGEINRREAQSNGFERRVEYVYCTVL